MDNIQFLENKAIDAAINSNWQEAIDLNKQILDHDENNIGSYLRLGFAYMQNDEIQEAETCYRKVLTLQKKHPIAMENIERIKVLMNKKSSTDKKPRINRLKADIFIEVPGKTKTIPLVNLGQKDDLAILAIGEPVELKLKKRKVEVRSITGEYIGTLPDDLSRRIIHFIHKGSDYSAHIKEASLNRVVLFIREESKGPHVQTLVSFPHNPNANMLEFASSGEQNDEEMDEEDFDEEEDSEEVDTEIDKDILRYRESQDEDEESEE